MTRTITSMWEMPHTKTVSDDSNRERRLQLVRDVCLDDESLEPANVLGLGTPPARERRDRVHVRRGQAQTRVGVGVVKTSFLTGGSRMGWAGTRQTIHNERVSKLCCYCPMFTEITL